MAELSILLNRMLTAPEATYVHNSHEYLARSTRDVQEKNWDAWLKAFKTYRDGHLQDTGQWLEVAVRQLQETPNTCCLAEVAQLYSQFLNEIGEYESSLGYARRSWDTWHAIAGNPEVKVVAAQVRPLFKLLYAPQDVPAFSDEKIFTIWLTDRFTLQFMEGFKNLLTLCGHLQQKKLGVKTITEVKNWYDKYLKKTGVNASVIVLSYADLLEASGNFYDQLHEYEASFGEFATALDKLKTAVDHPDTHRLRARLQFNAGNELNKLKRLKESVDYYAASLTYFQHVKDEEAAARIRHAILLNEWYLQERDVRADLEAILLTYERLYSNSNRDKQSQIIQNLQAANRLWLSLAAGNTIHSDLALNSFLTVVFSMRQETVGVHTKLEKAVSQPLQFSVFSQLSLVNKWFSGLERSVLFIIENGVDELVFSTLRSGNEPVLSRVTIGKSSAAFIAAFEETIRICQAEISDISNRVIGIQSAMAEDLLAAVKQVWEHLPAGIQRDLLWADTIHYSPGNYGSMDEFPFELVYCEDDYIGLKKSIVRVLSVDHLLQSLTVNRINKKPSGKALLVRADDVAGVNKLPYAVQELQSIKQYLTKTGYEVTEAHKPPAAALIAKLNNGVDVFHYTGHSEADEKGEYLVLNDTEDLRAIELKQVRQSPAPATVLSSCFAGRTRQFITGGQQGMAVTLLDTGAPAIVAATYEVPDQMGMLFSEAFYKNMAGNSLGQVLLAVRKALHKKGVNPVCWSSYLLIGQPDISFDLQYTGAPRSLRWPQALNRYICTEASFYFKETLALVAVDPLLSAEQQRILTGALQAFEKKDPAFWGNGQLPENNPFTAGGDIEYHFAYAILTGMGYLLFAKGNQKEEEDAKIAVVSRLLKIYQVLQDSYLLVAITDGLFAFRSMPLGDKNERDLFARAQVALSWLSADLLLLEEKHRSFAEWKAFQEKTMMMDAQTLAGVDAETFRRADEGDRQAQKRMLSNLLRKDAAATAITSDKPWTWWLLRVIGCAASRQSMADFLGVIYQERETGKMTTREYDVLLNLIEQYAGPGAVDDQTLDAAYEPFNDKALERSVITLFDYFDVVSTDSGNVNQFHISEIIKMAEAIPATGACTYFRGVWCQKEAERGGLTTAIAEALNVVASLEELAADDNEYTGRLGIMAFMLTQLYQYSKDLKAVESIQHKYGHAISVYQHAQS
jgi:hypothetical protein